MKTLSRWMLALALVFSTTLIYPHTNPKTNLITQPSVMADNTIALLPKSDVVAVLDLNRLLNDLLPKAKQIWPEQFAKFEKEFNDVFSKASAAGIDVYKLKSVAIGMNLFGEKTTGAMIVEGLTVTPELMSKENTERSTIDYKGKTLYIEKPKPEPKPVAKASAKTSGKRKVAARSKTQSRAKSQTARAKTSAQLPGGVPMGNVTDLASNVGSNLLKDNTAYVQLDETRAAIGDETQVKVVIDALTGSPTPSSNLSQELSNALQETKANGVLRFAVNIPESARKAAEGEEFLKNLAVTKMVLGTLDVSDEMSLLLDAKLRTNSADEASKLHESLAALLGLGKMMLGGNQDPTMQMFSKMLDQVRLSPQSNDVTLAITLPRELYETFLKSDSKATPTKNDK